MRISDWSSDVCSSDLSSGAGLDGSRPGARRIRMLGPAHVPLGSETVMKQLLHRATSGRMHPQTLRRELQHDDSSEMQFRRAIVGTSLVGMASMGTVSLLQWGISNLSPAPPPRRPH